MEILILMALSLFYVFSSQAIYRLRKANLTIDWRTRLIAIIGLSVLIISVAAYDGIFFRGGHMQGDLLPMLLLCLSGHVLVGLVNIWIERNISVGVPGFQSIKPARSSDLKKITYSAAMFPVIFLIMSIKLEAEHVVQLDQFMSMIVYSTCSLVILFVAKPIRITVYACSGVVFIANLLFMRWDQFNGSVAFVTLWGIAPVFVCAASRYLLESISRKHPTSVSQPSRELASETKQS
jgi:hypothetical protein